jgi:hypothetical protein
MLDDAFEMAATIDRFILGEFKGNQLGREVILFGGRQSKFQQDSG